MSTLLPSFFNFFLPIRNDAGWMTSSWDNRPLETLPNPEHPWVCFLWPPGRTRSTLQGNLCSPRCKEGESATVSGTKEKVPFLATQVGVDICELSGANQKLHGGFLTKADMCARLASLPQRSQRMRQWLVGARCQCSWGMQRIPLPFGNALTSGCLFFITACHSNIRRAISCWGIGLGLRSQGKLPHKVAFELTFEG